MIHFKGPPKATINLTNLKEELSCAKIANHCPKLSFKKIASYFLLATISIGPSCWDTGTDINQGQLYLNGDFYTKHVSLQNDTSVTDYNCTWIETTRKVLSNIESGEEVTYTYTCFEKDENWGYITLFFVFVFPGLLQGITVGFASRSLEAGNHKNIGTAIAFGLSLLSPFFPIQVFLVKLFAFLTDGPELKKISNLMTYTEATFESNLQFVLQLYIIFTRADRRPSTTQILSLSSSIVFMAKSHLESNFADKPNEPLLKKLPFLPQKLCFIVFFCGSLATLSSIFRNMFFMIGWIALSLCGGCLEMVCMKAKISQGEGWSDQKYKGMDLLILSRDALLFIPLLVFLVLINNFPDTTCELPKGLDYLGYLFSSQTELSTRFLDQTKLSDIAFVKENWANYLIPTILSSGVIFWVLEYKQIIKAEETIKISSKDDQQEFYEIPRGTLQDSPLETETVKVSVDGKTFIVPKDDLDIEKYPQELETKTMVKCSNKKEGCFKNLKKKVSCRVEDETPKPIKAYIVKIEDMKEMTVNPENCTDG